MFAGVPYLLLVLLGGLITGAVLAPLARSVSDSKFAGEYYRLTALLLSISFGINVVLMLGHPATLLTSVARISGTLLGLCFAGIFGIAIRRKDSRHLLGQPPVLAAIRMTVALTFVIAGIGKAFNMPFMTQFFTSSGYSIGFLKFIMLAEVLGAVGLLLPWAFLPALLGFTVDMLGAIVTHVHNGDPLDDSTGALTMLIRLAAIAVLVIITPHGLFSHFSPRSRVVIASTTAVVCLVIAITGTFMLHTAK